MMKNSIKRGQSQAGLSFAERKNFRPKVKNKLLLMLALLMTAATGAWGMQVYISYPSWPSGTTSLNNDGNLVLEMEPSDSFENLKSKIGDKTGFDPTYMHLFFNSVEMANNETLNDKGVTANSVLTLVYTPYNVTMKDGVKDADKWTAKVGDGQAQALPIGGLEGGETVTLKYNGRLKVKGVKATSDAAPAEEPVTLATPLTIEAITPGTIVVDIDGTLSKGMKYSVNGGTKTLIKTTTPIEGLKAGDKVQFYGNGTQTQVYGGFTEVSILGSGDGFKTKVYGNIMSLLDEEGFATKTDLPNAQYVFYGLFKGNTTLNDASELLLPATTLAAQCYSFMFTGCTSLTTAPKLPATTLAYQCYYSMFLSCTSLTNAYVKAAFTDSNNECESMFEGCSAAGAVLHTTPGSKASWEAKMGPDNDWENWSVADDWQE